MIKSLVTRLPRALARRVFVLFYVIDNRWRRYKRSTCGNRLKLELRTRISLSVSDEFQNERTVTEVFPARATAIIICDMWDKHWCSAAATRFAELAIRMNPVVKTAREQGVLVIHAPSKTLDFYARTSHRMRALAIPSVEPLNRKCVTNIPPMPIDDSDGGCDSGETLLDDNQQQVWSRQHPAIDITGDDLISDDGREVYNILQYYGITNLLIMGVATNMCVLNRSFGIKQMTRWGVNCMLVRDMTDSMYNPKRRPYVSHDRGTELVIEYVETYWCPSVSSNDLLDDYRV